MICPFREAVPSLRSTVHKTCRLAMSNDMNRLLTDSFNNTRKSAASRNVVSIPIAMATSGTPIRRDPTIAVLPKRLKGSPNPKIGTIGSQVVKIDVAKLATTTERLVLLAETNSKCSASLQAELRHPTVPRRFQRFYLRGKIQAPRCAGW
jgi:hypothetical protein